MHNQAHGAELGFLRWLFWPSDLFSNWKTVEEWEQTDAVVVQPPGPPEYRNGRRSPQYEAWQAFPDCEAPHMHKAHP